MLSGDEYYYIIHTYILPLSLACPIIYLLYINIYILSQSLTLQVNQHKSGQTKEDTIPLPQPLLPQTAN